MAHFLSKIRHFKVPVSHPTKVLSHVQSNTCICSSHAPPMPGTNSYACTSSGYKDYQRMWQWNESGTSLHRRRNSISFQAIYFARYEEQTRCGDYSYGGLRGEPLRQGSLGFRLEAANHEERGAWYPHSVW